MIPIPNSIVPLVGKFKLDTMTVITCTANALAEAQKLQQKLGLPVQISDPIPNSIHLELRICPRIESVNGWAMTSIAPTKNHCSVGCEPCVRPVRGGIFSFSNREVINGQILSSDLGNPEAYILEIRETGVQICSSGLAGLFYGCITLLQHNSSCVVITDKPRFAWRGSHLDVSRHFMPLEFLYQYVDLLALHKLNVLHLHLTDDQGWRLEIKKYPRLTEIGAWRSKTRVGHELSNDKSFNNTPHGGFYTQAQMLELVQYALERHITIVPEIEMPGHATAALAAYPEFGNTGIAPEVVGHWGIFESVFSPQEKTFAFLEDVLTEVLKIFPSPYIHIGGDECPKKEWKESVSAQSIMKVNHLEDEEALQSYFVGRINTFLKAQNRKMIGWDEILEGGLVDGATVMSWRGEAGGIIAAKAGHDVVMTPGTHTYFDHYQTENPDLEPLAIGGCTTLEKVYGYEPIPAELTELEGQRVLGSQAQLWTEYMPTSKDVERMAFPRLCALSEVLWTQPEARDYPDFIKRLVPHLETLGTNHHTLA